MKSPLAVIAASLCLFAAGTAGAADRLDPSAYHAKSKEEAAKALLQAALTQAGKGSWERIGVGRVYYLGGMKTEGQKIFDDVLAKKPEASDFYRVARVYREAGEWDKAKALFDKAIQQEPDAEKWLAEVGAYYLLNGDRARAEVMFEKSFKIESEVWATVAAAGAYLGVAPQE